MAAAFENSYCSTLAIFLVSGRLRRPYTVRASAPLMSAGSRLITIANAAEVAMCFFV